MRVVLATLGTLGDVHPFIALALGLQGRGHTPVFAGADRVIASSFSIHARIAAQAAGAPLASVLLQPITLLSAEDPPVLTRGETMLVGLRRWFGPGAVRPLLRLAERRYAKDLRPFAALRAAAGAPPFAGNEMLAGPLAVDRAVGLWSPVFSGTPAHAPAAFAQTGFVFYDGGFAGEGLSPALESLLAAGPPPLVFTLGSMAIYAEDGFYAASAAAARRLGRRAVLLVGDDPLAKHAALAGPDVLVAGYAPHSQLFPHAAAVIGHGGIGTTGQAIRAGVPQLVCPIFGDQFDNAARIVRVGLGLSLPKRRYTAERAAAVIDRLLHHPAITDRARRAGAAIAAEDGVGQALDALGLGAAA